MSVEAQYEAYPYPARDPGDEATRLITGSPSHPLELDHFLFGGTRDWSVPLRVLVAGGGTGDALVQLAQVMTSAKRPYEITYLDLSKAARGIAEARIKARGLEGVQFVTGSLLEAADHGVFDYIDCCGVLHHLPDPQAGFDALSDVLAPGGGLGAMVYAPQGRSGVYPLQQAFGTLLKGLAPEARLMAAKQIYSRLPEGHPFRRNPHLGDHEVSDAGFYDLLLHSQDQPFSIDRLGACLERAGLALAGLPQAALYDLSRFADIPDDMDAMQAMALAEKLDGTIKTHVFYARRAKDPAPAGLDAHAIPHLKGVDRQGLARKVARDGAVQVRLNGTAHQIRIAKSLTPVLAGINGRRSVADLKRSAGLDDLAWAALWPPLARDLTAMGLLLYSRLLV